MRQRTAARVPRGSSRSRFPQVRQAAETFASKLFPRVPKLLRTAPLKALVIGAFVRGLSMRDVESLSTRRDVVWGQWWFATSEPFAALVRTSGHKPAMARPGACRA